MNKRALFTVSALSLVTTSMSFAIRGDVANAMSAAFHISNEQLGFIFSPAFWAFAVGIVTSGSLVDLVGMKRLHVLSAAGYIAAVLLVVFAPRPAGPVVSLFDNPGTILLYVAFLVMGLSQGLVEGVINPLTITVYPEEKTRRLIMLHAWWPGGQIIGGLAAVFMTQVVHASWQVELSLIMVPAAIYLVMALAQRYPATERVQSNVTTGEMWRECVRPLFLLFCICNGLGSAAELGPDQWFPKVMGDLIPQFQGVLFLVYTAGLMFLLRTFGGHWSQRNPIVTTILCAVGTCTGLYWLGSLRPGAGAIVAFTAATVFGVGKTFFVPTMLGLVSEQVPRGGALSMSVMGGFGMLATAVALPLMGARIDQLGPGAALQMMALAPAALGIIFAGLWIYYRSRGGYRAVRLSPDTAPEQRT
jgi:MFS family permease